MLFGCSALITVAVASRASAQGAAEGGATLGEIIVTAQKREQSLQDVPVAVTALSQDTLQANRVTSLLEVNNLAPSLMITSPVGGVGLPIISMRGSVSSTSAPGHDKSVSLNLDGVYLGNSYGAGFDLPDIERIEVLRGPQGTLFGRNSTAGAINITTRNPSGKFGLRQEITVGNYDHLRTVTRVELPAWGPLSAYVSFTHDEREGDIKNLGAGAVWDRTASQRRGVEVSPKTLGDKNANSWFAAVKFEPTDNINAVYKFDRSKNHYTPDGSGLLLFTPEQAGFAFLRPIFNANPPPISGLDRPKYVNNAWTVPGEARSHGHNLTLNMKVNDHLSFKNILAYRYNYVYGTAQITGAGGLINILPFLGPVGAPILLGDTQTEAIGKQWSEELEANYDSEYLTVTAGAIYYKLKTVAGAPEGLAGPGRTNFVGIAGGRLPAGRDNTRLTSTSKAAYIQAEVHVTQQLDVVGGYRITKDKKSGTNYILSAPFPLFYEKTKPSYLAGVDYKPTQDVLVYGRYGSSFVSGGSVSGIEYPAESARSWEAGVKADLLERRLRVNLAAYRATYKHLQRINLGFNIGRPELGAVILDQGDAKVKGVEAEVTAAPMRGLTLSTAVGYTDFKFTLVRPAFSAFGGFEAWLLPKWTVSLAASYETEPLFDDVRLMGRLDGNWQSKIASPGTYLPITPGYTATQYSGKDWMVNGRLALRNIKLSRGDLEVAIWGKNLLDQDGPKFPLQFSPVPYLGATNYLPARTFGLDIIYNY